ncbi:DUF4192 family protein [Janibacter terrae]|uniref:DUF4192 family protein n=1 Tax=Janibacter terrae TaxID=103817 RepID=UPI000833E0C2|nr:DUF4192 family protein [Janibacter terrae]
MHAAPTLTPVRLDAPGVAAVVPHMFGFEPSDSLVLFGVDGQPNSARIDASAVTPRLLPESVHVVNRLHASGARRVVAIGYGQQMTPEAMEAVVSQIVALGLSVADYGTVAGRCWHSLTDGQRTPLPEVDPAILARFSPDGFVSTSREQMRATFVPTGDDALAATLDAASVPTAEDLPGVAQAWAALLDGRNQPTPFALLTILPMLRNPHCRDALIAALTDNATVRDAVAAECAPILTAVRSAHGDQGAKARAALAAICRATPERHAPDVLAVAAATYYDSGHGAHANAAVETALRIDPEHRLSALLGRVLDAGLDPHGLRG